MSDPILRMIGTIIDTIHCANQKRLRKSLSYKNLQEAIFRQRRGGDYPSLDFLKCNRVGTCAVSHWDAITCLLPVSAGHLRLFGVAERWFQHKFSTGSGEPVFARCSRSRDHFAPSSQPPSSAAITCPAAAASLCAGGQLCPVQFRSSAGREHHRPAAAVPGVGGCHWPFDLPGSGIFRRTDFRHQAESGWSQRHAGSRGAGRVQCSLRLQSEPSGPGVDYHDAAAERTGP